MPGKYRLYLAAILQVIPALASAVEGTRPAYAPPPSPVSSGSIVQIIFSLLLVLAAIALVGWLLKRVNTTKLGSGNLLRVLGSVAIGQRERIVLVEVNDTWLVVGVGPGQIRNLHTLPKQESPDPEDTPPGPRPSETKFAKLLSAVLHPQPAGRNRNAP